MKTMNKSTLKNQEQQQDSLSCENLNINESSSSSHVQRYINTLAVVEEEQRSILVDESASLPIALCMENTHSCDLINRDTAQRISNIQEVNSQPQHVEFEMTTINTLQRADDNNTSNGNLRDTKEVHQLDLNEIQVDSSQYQQQATFDTDQYHLETAVAVLDDRDLLEITFAEVDQSLHQQQQEQQHPPPTASN
jgi:hypothetical protein